MPAAATAVEVLAVTNEDGSVNSKENPAAPGSLGVVYAVGFGQTSPASVDGQINATGVSLRVSPQVNIGGQNAQILYAGGAPRAVAGLTQINFRVPELSNGQYTVYVGSGPLRPGSDYNSAVLFVGR